MITKDNDIPSSSTDQSPDAPASNAASGRAPRVFQGTRAALSPALKLPTGTPGNSFMITNRNPLPPSGANPNNPNDVQPLPNGEMYWLLSTSQANDPNPENYTAQGNDSFSSVPSSFNQAIIETLQAQSSPNLTVFIHGLGNLLVPDAYWGTSSLGANLATFADYQGLVIGFDWPSFDEWDSVCYSTLPYAFPPAATSNPQTIRDNIEESVPAFNNLLTFLNDLGNSVQGLSVSLVCHSEGNYMAMLGLRKSTSWKFTHILLVAADINSGAFLELAGGNIGQGEGISESGIDVTVYYSSNDDVLPDSRDYFKSHHNPSYPDRLGLSGASSGQKVVMNNVVSVDCSNVVDTSNVQYLQSSQGNCVVPIKVDGYQPTGQAPSDLTIHTSYFFIPQVLQDMAYVLTHQIVAPDAVPNRQSTPVTQNYEMTLNNTNNGNTNYC